MRPPRGQVAEAVPEARAKRKWARYRRSEARRQAPPDVADERLELLLEDFETRFVDDTPAGTGQLIMIIERYMLLLQKVN